MSAKPLTLGSFSQEDANMLLAGNFVLHAVDGVLNPALAGRRMITKATAAALTLAAPALADDGIKIQILSSTAAAHTVTATGLFQDGAAHVNTATFAAQAGANMSIVAYQGKWIVTSLQGVTMS